MKLILVGTLAGLSLSACAQSLYFNGVAESTIADCPALDTNGELTAECWIKPDNTHPEQLFRYIFSKNYGSEGWGLLMSVDYRLHGTGLGHAPAQTPIGVWSHVAYVISHKKVKIYLNGDLVASGDVTEPLHNSTLQLCVGCSPFFGYPGDQQTNFTGHLTRVRVWDKPYTQEEVRSHMRKKLSGREKHLVVCLDFESGHGSLVKNKTGKTPPLMLGRSYRQDQWDPVWSKDKPF